MQKHGALCIGEMAVGGLHCLCVVTTTGAALEDNPMPASRLDQLERLREKCFIEGLLGVCPGPRTRVHENVLLVYTTRWPMHGSEQVV
jgi:hypothetical protein